MTNSENPGYAAGMSRALRELTMSLRNMIFMRKLKDVSVVNSIEALGIIPGEAGMQASKDEILRLWGDDPVHPSSAAYARIAARVMERQMPFLRRQPLKLQCPRKEN